MLRSHHPAPARHEQLLLVLVGLPARGKSFIAMKIRSFFRWRGINCESFNVGAARRQVKTESQTASFFAAGNAAAKQKREQLAMNVLHSALAWLTEGGNVAILDATNTTKSRRLHVLQSIVAYSEECGTSLPYVVFVECICNDVPTLRSNMLQKVTNSPDYENMPVADALADLQARIAEYEKVYEPVDDSEDETSPAVIGPISYIKLIDLQAKVICRHIFGSSAFSLVSFLMVIHIGLRPIWLVRAGQCTDDLVRKAIRDNAAQVEATSSHSPHVAAARGPAAPAAADPPATADADGALPVSRRGSDAPEAGTSARTGAAAGAVPSIAPTALSAGLTLNPHGKEFANMLADFVLRRSAQGSVHRSHMYDQEQIPPALPQGEGDAAGETPGAEIPHGPTGARSALFSSGGAGAGEPAALGSAAPQPAPQLQSLQLPRPPHSSLTGETAGRGPFLPLDDSVGDGSSSPAVVLAGLAEDPRLRVRGASLGAQPHAGGDALPLPAPLPESLLSSAGAETAAEPSPAAGASAVDRPGAGAPPSTALSPPRPARSITHVSARDTVRPLRVVVDDAIMSHHALQQPLVHPTFPASPTASSAAADSTLQLASGLLPSPAPSADLAGTSPAQSAPGSAETAAAPFSGTPSSPRPQSPVLPLGAEPPSMAHASSAEQLQQQPAAGVVGGALARRHSLPGGLQGGGEEGDAPPPIKGHPLSSSSAATSAARGAGREGAGEDAPSSRSSSVARGSNVRLSPHGSNSSMAGFVRKRIKTRGTGDMGSGSLGNMTPSSLADDDAFHAGGEAPPGSSRGGSAAPLYYLPGAPVPPRGVTPSSSASYQLAPGPVEAARQQAPGEGTGAGDEPLASQPQQPHQQRLLGGEPLPRNIRIRVSTPAETERPSAWQGRPDSVPPAAAESGGGEEEVEEEEGILVSTPSVSLNDHYKKQQQQQQGPQLGARAQGAAPLPTALPRAPGLTFSAGEPPGLVSTAPAAAAHLVASRALGIPPFAPHHPHPHRSSTSVASSLAGATAPPAPQAAPRTDAKAADDAHAASARGAPSTGPPDAALVSVPSPEEQLGAMGALSLSASSGEAIAAANGQPGAPDAFIRPPSAGMEGRPDGISNGGGSGPAGAPPTSEAAAPTAAGSGGAAAPTVTAAQQQQQLASYYSMSSETELVVYDAPPAIYTSTLPRTLEMVIPIPYVPQQLSALNPMETGICLGIPLQFIKGQFPEEYDAWVRAPDRATHRITGGESLMDVVTRLTPFVIELERSRRPVLVVSHLSTLQVLLAYFKGVPLAECVDLDFPMNTVVEFTPHQYGWLEKRFSFTKAKLDTHITTHVVW